MLTETLLEILPSELKEEELAQDFLEDILDLQADVTSSFQVVSTNEWHLAIIPDHPPLLTFIPFTYKEVLTISIVMNSYQSNLPIYSDLTPINLCPFIVKDASGNYADISAPVTLNPLIQGINAEKIEEKLRHLSSSSSSRTSEACYLSAEEDTSLNDDLFYDPMRMEPIDSFHQSLESPLKLEEEEISGLEFQPKMEPLSAEHEAGVIETLIRYHTTDEEDSQNFVSLDEKQQDGAFEISSEFDRSVESLLLTEDFVKTESSQRPSVRFNDTEEIIVFGDDYSDGKTSNDGSVIEDEMADESIEYSNQALQIIEDLKIETEKILEDTAETSSELPKEVSESNQIIYTEREPFTDKHLVEETEIPTQIQDISTKDNAQLLDERGKCGSLEISTAFDKVEDGLSLVEVSPKSVSEEIQLSENTESLSITANIVHSIVDALLNDSQKAGLHELVSEFEDRRKEKNIAGSQDDQKTLCFNLGSVQVHGSLLECAQENTKKPDISLSPIVEENQFHDQILINDTVSSVIQDNVWLKDNRADFEQVLGKSLEPETSYKNLSAQEESSRNQIQVEPKLIEELIQKNLESVSEALKVNIGYEGADEITNESSAEFNANLDFPVSLKSQLEPMKNQALAEEAESVSIYQISTNSRKASLQTDEMKQAGLSEKSSAFDKTKESAVFVYSDEQLEVGDIMYEGSNVAADVVKSIEDTNVNLQQTESNLQHLFNETEQIHENASELVEELTSKDESNVELSSHREPMKDQIQIGKSESSGHFDDRLGSHESDMTVSESQQAGTSEMSSAFKSTEGVALSIESNIEPGVNKIEAFEDFGATPPDSDLKPSFSGLTMNDSQQAGSSEVVPGFSEEIMEVKSKEVMESINATEVQLHYGTEQAKEREFENFDNLNIREELAEMPKSEMQSIDHKNIVEGAISVLQFDCPSTENKQLFVDESKQVGSSEMSVLFVEVDTLNPMAEVVDEGLGTATQSDQMEVKAAQDQVLIHQEPVISETTDSILGAEISKDIESQSMSSEAAFILQSPISPQELNSEAIDDFDNADYFAVNLQLETHLAKYLLPEQVELHPLEQPFNLLNRNADFEERSIKEIQESTDGKLTTFPVEIVISDESKSEPDQCSAQELSQQTTGNRAIDNDLTKIPLTGIFPLRAGRNETGSEVPFSSNSN
ncbi:hypothetical protein ACTXT7_010125 [Hymenolepis weldensis]